MVKCPRCGKEMNVGEQYKCSKCGFECCSSCARAPRCQQCGATKGTIDKITK